MFHFGIVVSVTTVTLILVFAITIVLHIRKIKAIRNALSVTRYRQSQIRMNVVVTVITTIFVLFNIFLITQITFLEYLKQHVHGYVIFSILQLGTALMGFLNYSCNPYILFISHSIFAHLNRSRIYSNKYINNKQSIKLIAENNMIRLLSFLQSKIRTKNFVTQSKSRRNVQCRKDTSVSSIHL